MSQSSEQLSRLQPENRDYEAIEGRFETLRKVARLLQIEVPAKYESDQHFWFLVGTDFYQQHRNLRKKLKVQGHHIPIPHTREIAMTAAVTHAVELYRLQEQQATDSLTGLWARGALDNRILLLQKWVKQAEKAIGDKESILVLYFLDIDNFKQFNDQYSHAVGDLMLKKMAQSIQQFSRTTVDMVARYGGEEFAAIKVMSRKKLLKSNPDLSLEDLIEQQAEQFRQNIVNKLSIMVEQDGETKQLSAKLSLGVIRVDPDQPLDNVYALASKTMERAKAAGRNRSFSPRGEIVLKENG